MNKIISLLLVLMSVLTCSANSVDATFYSNQKYYVVAAVLSIIFIGIVVFLIKIERRLKKLEK